MKELLNEFLLTFIPLFVAMDALGVVGIFLSLTRGQSEASRKKLVTEATLTALVISLIFLPSGRMLFSFLGISENDFRIAGGIVLLILAIMDLLFSQHEDRRDPKTAVGIVPIGIPLIMGPAALTTILILVEQHGYLMTLVSLLLNLFIVWLVFSQSKWVVRVMGDAGTKAFAKVASLFLAAIAVMMIRVGVQNIIGV